MTKNGKPNPLRLPGVLKSGLDRKQHEQYSSKPPYFPCFLPVAWFKIFAFSFGCGEMMLAALAVLIAGGLRHV